jgi:2-polyprenyl-6-methoxyphenol hydroxylase-like FAD-dependent oxidoreductase
MNTPQHDIVIMGGGLAGLTLALQLRQRLPDLDVLILERRQHPVPEAAFKIGESTVEIGAHYFENVLGLREHLMEKQLKKFGFRFFFSEGRTDIAAVTELGASFPLPVGSWQIDRGIFENFLGEEVQRRGMRFVDGATIRGVTLAEADGDLHTVTWQHTGEEPQTVQARWVIDACGRASLLKRKLNLTKGNEHPVHSVWFRIQDRITPDDWTDRHRLARPLPWPHALAVHQPPGGRGLLVVADPAFFGFTFGGHRGRPALAPAGRNEHLRARDGLDQGAPAAPV